MPMASPERMKSVPGLAVPLEFYLVLEHPAPLAGMAYPRSSPWQGLASEGLLHEAAQRRTQQGAGLEGLAGARMAAPAVGGMGRLIEFRRLAKGRVSPELGDK